MAYKDGVETYVFQPTFCGTASTFGLILPVPSTLTESPALSDQQAFTAVDSLSQPTYVTVTSCYPSYNGSGGATGGTTSGVDTGTSVVASGRVGFLDWVQLKADTQTSFTDWLTTNGYPYSTAASSVFFYYVQKGWYFVAFKISQGAVRDGGNGVVCNALGPVKLSFTSTVPVVPSRMASAGTATGTYASGFSWRIFGITTGDQQLAFTDGANTNRVLGYSGALTASDVSSLSVLAQAGDRLTKLTLTFSYGSTEPDVGLNLASATDYRETRYTTQYVRCDAGTGTAIDAAADSFADGRLAAEAAVRPVQDASAGFDALPSPAPEAGPKLDTNAQVVGDASPRPDTGVQVVPDARTGPDTAPVPAGGTTGTSTTGFSAGGNGCSLAGASTSGGFFALALLVLAGRLRKRRGS
jgi:MYXO-CTERM domain-containing protein